jgi:hypothetical protein
VHRLEALVVARLAAGADPTEPIFINPNNNRPYSRNVFVSHLKVYRRGGVSLHLGLLATTTSCKVRQRDQFL